MSSYIPHFKPFTKLSGRRGSNPRPSAWENLAKWFNGLYLCDIHEPLYYFHANLHVV